MDEWDYPAPDDEDDFEDRYADELYLLKEIDDGMYMYMYVGIHTTCVPFYFATWYKMGIRSNQSYYHDQFKIPVRPKLAE